MPNRSSRTRLTHVVGVIDKVASGLLIILIASQAHALRSVIVTERSPLHVSPPGRKIALIRRSDVVTVLAKAQGYYKVRNSEGRIGWLFARYVSGGRRHAIVKAERVFLRSAPPGRTIGLISEGSQARILLARNGFYRIQTSNGTRGWVPQRAVNAPKSSHDVPTVAAPSADTVMPTPTQTPASPVADPTTTSVPGLLSPEPSDRKGQPLGVRALRMLLRPFSIIVLAFYVRWWTDPLKQTGQSLHQPKGFRTRVFFLSAARSHAVVATVAMAGGVVQKAMNAPGQGVDPRIATTISFFLLGVGALLTIVSYGVRQTYWKHPDYPDCQIPNRAAIASLYGVGALFWYFVGVT